jgi:hypothetical protein
MRSLLLIGTAGIVLGLVNPTPAHDSWINRGAYRNTAGEWCCGAGDCFPVAAEKVSVNGAGYVLREYNNELVPFSESQPSPDGAFWRCKRADGTRRCFFAPPPST